MPKKLPKTPPPIPPKEAEKSPSNFMGLFRIPTAGNVLPRLAVGGQSRAEAALNWLRPAFGTMFPTAEKAPPPPPENTTQSRTSAGRGSAANGLGAGDPDSAARFSVPPNTTQSRILGGEARGSVISPSGRGYYGVSAEWGNPGAPGADRVAPAKRTTAAATLPLPRPFLGITGGRNGTKVSASGTESAPLGGSASRGQEDNNQTTDSQTTGHEALKMAAEFLKILSHPKRLEILFLLLPGGLCVGDIARSCGLQSHLTSEHLRMMERSGIVGGKRQGRQVIYEISDPHTPKFLLQIQNKYR